MYYATAHTAHDIHSNDTQHTQTLYTQRTQCPRQTDTQTARQKDTAQRIQCKEHFTQTQPRQHERQHNDRHTQKKPQHIGIPTFTRKKTRILLNTFLLLIWTAFFIIATAAHSDTARQPQTAATRTACHSTINCTESGQPQTQRKRTTKATARQRRRVLFFFNICIANTFPL